MKTKDMVYAAGSLLIAGTTAIADPTTTLGVPFYPGSNNSNTNFVIERFTEPNGNQIELGIKAKERFVGDANVARSGTTYFVQPGYSPMAAGDPTLHPDYAWWNFDYSINLGDRTLQNTTMELVVDFLDDMAEPTTISLNFILPFYTHKDNVPTTEPNLYQASMNIGFGLFDIFGGNFDPNLQGTYEITLNLYDGLDLDPFTSVTMQAVVVPLPTAAGMAFAGIGLLGARRRR